MGMEENKVVRPRKGKEKLVAEAAGKSVLREYAEAIVIAVILALFIMTFIARSFSVDGSSMYPTLHHGERLLVDEITYRFREPQRGDIVVFKYPANPKAKFIKRVIGLPGDTVLIRDGTLLLNGEPLSEPYLGERMVGDYGPYVVPPGTVFVLGDNRNYSEDSRYRDVGYVPRDYMVGRAVLRFWPLNRIGVIKKPSTFESGAAAAAPR